MRDHKRGKIVVQAPVNGEPGLQVWRLRGSRVSLGTIVAAWAISCKAEWEWSFPGRGVLQRFGFSAVGWRGSYRPISPPPGSLIAVTEPHRSSFTGFENSAPLACKSLTVSWMLSHIR